VDASVLLRIRDKIIMGGRRREGLGRGKRKGENQAEGDVGGEAGVGGDDEDVQRVR